MLVNYIRDQTNFNETIIRSHILWEKMCFYHHLHYEIHYSLIWLVIRIVKSDCCKMHYYNQCIYSIIVVSIENKEKSEFKETVNLLPHTHNNIKNQQNICTLHSNITLCNLHDMIRVRCSVFLLLYTQLQ